MLTKDGMAQAKKVMKRWLNSAKAAEQTRPSAEELKAGVEILVFDFLDADAFEMETLLDDGDPLNNEQEAELVAYASQRAIALWA